MFKITKKKLVAAAVGIAVVASAGVGYAYWTSTGTGTGTAKVGTASTWAVTTTPDSLAATTHALSPDGPTQTVGITVKNNGSGTQRLASLTISVANNDGSPWIAVSGCSASDFSVGGEAVGVSHVITSGEDIAASGTNTLHSVTVQMKDSGDVQDLCKGVTVPLYVSAV
jgi:hypothetical protein